MAIDNIIPSVWAGELLRALRTALVYADRMNRDYEGEIAAAGDSVRINMIGDVTISNYAKNTNINAPEALDDAQLILQVDQQKYFNFQIDDIDAAQQKPAVMQEAMSRSAYGLKKAADSFAAGLYTDISATNFIGTDGAPKTDMATAKVPYNYLVDLSVLLDAADTPEEGRFAVIPPWMEGYLLKDDRFVGFGTGPQDTRLTNGKIGRAAGFDLYKSNQVPNTTATKYKIIAGHPMAWAWADQILKVEGYRPELRFGDAMKGLYVYGAKVLRPDNLAVLTANPT